MEIKVDTVDIITCPLQNNITLVEIYGNLDVFTVTRFKDLMMDFLEKRFYNIILCLDTLRSIDSSGLGALIALKKKLRAFNGNLVLICSSPHFRKIFAITGIERMFTFSNSMKEGYEELLNQMQFYYAHSC